MNLEYNQRYLESETGDTFYISKYWDDDNDANKYKINLINVVTAKRKSFYSDDFKSLIREGKFKYIETFGG